MSYKLPKYDSLSRNKRCERTARQKFRDFREDFDTFEYRFSIPFLEAEKDIIKICRFNRIIKLLKSYR